MKKTILVAVAGAAAAFAPVAGAEVFGDVARVLEARPVYETVSEPRRECRTEQVTAYEERGRLVPRDGYRTARNDGIGPGAVLGAIIGGVVGHQVGSGRGNDVATAAGAVMGGLIGREAERGAYAAHDEMVVERVPVTREVQRCREVAEARERIVGYDVLYEYHGREMRARLPHDPGPQLAVNVEVRPPAAPARPYPVTPRYRGPY